MTVLRQIFLLRHAKSSWDDPAQSDFDRPLNPRGHHAAQRMCRHIRHMGIRPERILCSSALRTRMTLDLLQDSLGGCPVTYLDSLYEARAADLADQIRHLDDGIGSVMLVAHNPGLEALTRWLSDGQGDPVALDRLDIKFSTGAMAHLPTPIATWRKLDRGCAHLAAFIRPRDLAPAPP